MGIDKYDTVRRIRLLILISLTCTACASFYPVRALMVYWAWTAERAAVTLFLYAVIFCVTTILPYAAVSIVAKAIKQRAIGVRASLGLCEECGYPRFINGSKCSECGKLRADVQPSLFSWRVCTCILVAAIICCEIVAVTEELRFMSDASQWHATQPNSGIVFHRHRYYPMNNVILNMNNNGERWIWD